MCLESLRRKVDQELQGGYMSILFTKRLLKTLGKVDQELQGTYMSIVPTKCLLKKPYQKSPESQEK